MNNAFKMSIFLFLLILSISAQAKTIKNNTYTSQKKGSAQAIVQHDVNTEPPVINFKYKCKSESGEISYQEHQKDNLECWLMTLNEIKKLQVASIPTDPKIALSPTDFMWARDKYTDNGLVVTNTPVPPPASAFPNAYVASKYQHIETNKVDGKTQLTLIDGNGKKTILNAQTGMISSQENTKDKTKSTTKNSKNNPLKIVNQETTENKEVSALSLLTQSQNKPLSLEDIKQLMKNKSKKGNTKLIATPEEVAYAKKLDEKVTPIITPIETGSVQVQALGTAEGRTNETKDNSLAQIDSHKNKKEDKKTEQSKEEQPLDALPKVASDTKSDVKSEDKQSLSALPAPKGFKIDLRTD